MAGRGFSGRLSSISIALDSVEFVEFVEFWDFCGRFCDSWRGVDLNRLIQAG